jgi:hypothetical protein
MPDNQPTPTIGSTAPTTAAPAKPARLADALVNQLGALLSKALADASSLEVRTFTSSASDSEPAGTGDPLGEHARLRAFTRIAMDGDTQQCIPLQASGVPDEQLWALHMAAVEQARRDRAASIDAALAIIKELTGR